MPPEENGDRAALLPKCPHCGASPARLAIAAIEIANGRHAAYFCANPDCRALFSVQLIEVIAPENQVQAVENRLIVPN